MDTIIIHMMMMMMIGIYLDTQIILYSYECGNEKKNEKRENKILGKIKNLDMIEVGV